LPEGDAGGVAAGLLAAYVEPAQRLGDAVALPVAEDVAEHLGVGEAGERLGGLLAAQAVPDAVPDPVRGGELLDLPHGSIVGLRGTGWVQLGRFGAASVPPTCDGAGSGGRDAHARA